MQGRRHGIEPPHQFLVAAEERAQLGGKRIGDGGWPRWWAWLCQALLQLVFRVFGRAGQEAKGVFVFQDYDSGRQLRNGQGGRKVVLGQHGVFIDAGFELLGQHGLDPAVIARLDGLENPLLRVLAFAHNEQMLGPADFLPVPGRRKATPRVQSAPHNLFLTPWVSKTPLASPP